MSTLAPGQSVGRYRIVRFLGAGAMGEVYLADDPQIDRQLAIKTVRLAGRESDVDDRKKRLLREARAAGRMLHPNIVTLFDAGEADGLLFLAFEYVEGRDLASRMEAPERLTLREVLRIGRYVAEALQFAHRQGIVHRDIKPGNILLDGKGGVKVADFGIAKVAGQETELTMAGSVLGSPQYLSPEQIRGEDLDGRSDLFSLGVVIYEILSRKRPFVGDTLTTLCYSILTKEPPPLSDLRAVPARLEALIGRMLAKDREDRVGTAAEISRELSAIELELAEETLLSPAGGESEKTTVLPRRSTTGAGPIPPPPPLLSPSTKLTAQPAAAATSAPPVATAERPGFVPPPPPLQEPVPPFASASTTPALAGSAPGRGTPQRAPGSPVPATPLSPSAPRAAKPAMRNGAKILIAVGALAVLMTLGGLGGWMVARRFGLIGDPAKGEEATSVPASSDAVVPESSSSGTVEPSVAAPATSPAARAAGVTAPPSAPTAGGAHTLVQSGEAPSGGAPRSGEPGGAPANPGGSGEPSMRPAPETRGGAPAVVPPAPHLPPAFEPAPISREPEDQHPATRPAPADRTVASGLQATFQVEPPDAFLLIDGTVVGRAAEWAGGKRGKVFNFPGVDTYRLKVKRDGMRTAEIEVEVSELGGVTPISIRLRPLAGAGAEAEQLSAFRTADSISFKVRPATASFSVDGVPKGPIQRYSGGFGHSGWLSLTPGRHRISVFAPGYQQQDVIVDVSGSASEEKVPIALTLVQGG